MAALFVTPVLAGCDSGNSDDGGNQQGTQQGGGSGGGATNLVDYVSQLHLDLTSETVKQEVTVRQFIDGDTTHFDPVTNSTVTDYNANKSTFAQTYGYIKARYLAVNTPESTGDVEKWGKTASNFTREKLTGVHSIIVESDDSNWNVDSTGERYTLWIWYQKEAGDEYRNLNVELLQNGYGFAQNTETNRYGTNYALPALMQAKANNLVVYSNEKDPNFYEGAPIEISLKELRCCIDEYTQKTVRVEGVITTQMENNIYLEEYDPETGLYFGIVVFYGYNLDTYLRKILTIGNRVSLCGTATNSEEFGAQISGLSYDPRNLNDPKNTYVVKDEDGNELKNQSPAFAETKVVDFMTKTVKPTVERVTVTEDEDGNRVETPDIKEFPINYGEAVMNTTIRMENLYVERAYTTHNGGENDGAISLTCYQLDENGVEVTANGQKIKVAADEKGKAVTVTVRTTVLHDADGSLVLQSRFVGKTINAQGIVDQYDGVCQLKVHLLSYIEILD